MADERKEFDLIQRLFVPLAAERPGALGLKDDAATLPSQPGIQYVVTTDCLIQGVHFRSDDPPAAVAARSLRSNLSDLAAMGATPDCYTLALALPRSCDDVWMNAFVQQLGRDQKVFGIDLIGGDTVSNSGPMMITITAIGTTPDDSAVRRSTALVGDDIYVSGFIGDATLGLSVLNGNLTELSEKHTEYLQSRFWFPTPRTTLGSALLETAAAMADISDGLIADLGHICRAAGVTATISAEDVPLSSAAKSALAANNTLVELSIITLLTGGDDYELVFTAPPSALGIIKGISQRMKIPVTKIGTINKTGNVHTSQPITIISADGHPMEVTASPGYEHQW